MYEIKQEDTTQQDEKKDTEGTTKDTVGTRKDTAGTTKDTAGTTKDTVGTKKNASGGRVSPFSTNHPTTRGPKTGTTGERDAAAGTTTPADTDSENAA